MIRAGKVGCAWLLSWLCLTSCAPAPGETGAQGETAQIYYALVPEDGAERVLDALTLPVPPDTEDALRWRLTMALTPPEAEGFYTPFAENTRLISAELNGFELTVSLSAPYGTLSGAALTLADACLTLTAAQDKRVSHVRILVEDQPHPAREDRLYTASDLLLSDKPAPVTERSITLYFPNEANRYLWPEIRKIVIREKETAARYIWEELARGPQSESLRAVIPPDTRLLSVTLQDRLCTLNLSPAFLDNIPAETAAQRMTLCAIVNSMAELPDVEQVSLLVEGVPVAIWGHFSLREPLAPDPDALDRADETLEDVTVYYPNALNTQVIPVAIRVPKAHTGDPPGQYALDALFTRTPPPGCQSPVPAGGRVLSYTVADGVGILDVNRAFLDHHAGGSAGEIMTLACVVNTLTAFSGVRRVQLLIEGERRQHFVQTVIYDPLPPMTELIAR